MKLKSVNIQKSEELKISFDENTIFRIVAKEFDSTLQNAISVNETRLIAVDNTTE